MNAALPRPTLPPAIQGQLGLKDPRWRPLADVKTVLHELGEFDIDAMHVRELIEQRVLIGFNIAVRTESKPEWRVLSKSIDFFRTTGGKKYHELEWEKIFRLIVPHKKPVVTGLEFRRALICDRGHIENLILANCLVSKQKSQPGPGGSWVLSRESCESFLKERMQ